MAILKVTKYEGLIKRDLIGLLNLGRIDLSRIQQIYGSRETYCGRKKNNLFASIGRRIIMHCGQLPNQIRLESAGNA